LVDRYSVADRQLLLEKALERYIVKGWTVDDRFGCTAVIAKEWGALYALSAFSIPDHVKDSAGRPSGRAFKRRYVSVDGSGKVSVKRAPSRGEQPTRYSDTSRDSP
jgi:hypothetical protein